MGINVEMILLVAITMAAMWAVMSRSLFRATVGLAFTSAILVILMFNLLSPIAAVFELSVCTGIITAIIVVTISLTRSLTRKEIMGISKNKIKRYWALPVILIFAGIALLIFKVPVDMKLANAPSGLDVRGVFWNERRLELFGQIVIIIAGAFGVVILFREGKRNG